MGNWTYWGWKTGNLRDAEDTKKCPVEKYFALFFLLLPIFEGTADRVFKIR